MHDPKTRIAEQISGGATIGRDELTEKVYRSCNVQARREARSLVDEVIATIADALVTDGVVSLHGFGVFRRQGKAERMGRNPKSREEYVISARHVVRFKPSNILRARVAAPAAAQSTRWRDCE